MDILNCNLLLDSNGRELNKRGSDDFPVAISTHQFENQPVPYHWHEELELIVVTNGRLEVVVEQKLFSLKTGECAFINSGRLHSYSSYEKANCTANFFSFHSKFVYGDGGSVLYKNYISPLLQETAISYIVLPSEYSNLIQDLYCRLLNKDFAFEFEVRAKLSDIMIYLVRENEKVGQTFTNRKVRMINRCKTMMSFIHQNFGNNISLLDIANSANIRENECLRCFKNVLNTSPIRYLKKHRLEQAALSLRTSTRPVIDIAMECGFFDMSYFSKSFKALFAQTPTEYRNF